METLENHDISLSSTHIFACGGHQGCDNAGAVAELHVQTFVTGREIHTGQICFTDKS